MKRGKQRSGSEHLSLSSGTSPDAFIRFGLLGELQLPTVISIKLRHKAGASAGAGERRGDHAVRVRQPRHRQRGLRPPSRHARLEDGSRGAAGFGAAAAPRGGFGRAKTKGSERRAAGSLRPQRPPPAAGAPLFRSRTGTAEAGGAPSARRSRSARTAAEHPSQNGTQSRRRRCSHPAGAERDWGRGCAGRGRGRSPPQEPRAATHSTAQRRAARHTATQRPPARPRSRQSARPPLGRSAHAPALPARRGQWAAGDAKRRL